MTNTDRQKGHEILGEKWHEIVDSKFQVGDICSCGNVVRHGQSCGPMRTLTTPDDAYALEQALTEGGLNGAFGNWMDGQSEPAYAEITDQYIQLTPEQRCQLIIDFYKERNV